MAKRGRPSLTHGWSACASKYLKPGTRPLLRYRSGEFTRHLAFRPVAANHFRVRFFVLSWKPLTVLEAGAFTPGCSARFLKR